MQAKAGTLKDSVLDCPKTKHAKVAPSNENFDKNAAVAQKNWTVQNGPNKKFTIFPKKYSNF